WELQAGASFTRRTRKSRTKLFWSTSPAKALNTPCGRCLRGKPLSCGKLLNRLSAMQRSITKPTP
ncbi:MAG: hypothetical protein AVDCRST_MAG91-3482, partial [uncultured Sphingomonadaceae bacterium]